MRWLKVRTPHHQDYMLNVDAYLMAREESDGAYFVNGTREQSVKVLTAFSDIDFPHGWPLVETSSGLVRINPRFYSLARAEGDGTYLLCVEVEHSLSIFESLDAFLKQLD